MVTPPRGYREIHAKGNVIRGGGNPGALLSRAALDAIDIATG